MSSAMASCSVCDDEITSENPLHTCIDCGVKVHKFCYGIEDNVEKWKCSPCNLAKTKFVKCQLCLQKNGAMKQTVCNKWVHVICALFTSGVTIMNETTMEPIDISAVSNKKFNRICSFCYSAQGFCSTCATKMCKNRLHITCAQKHNTLKEIVDPNDDTIKFHAFCKEHKPKDTSRRVSSESVKNIVRKKRNKNKVVSENSNWISDAVRSQSTPKKNHLKRSCTCMHLISLTLFSYGKISAFM